MRAHKDKGKIIKSGLSRRDLIKLGLLTAAACVMPVKALGSVEDILSTERTLSFHNLHTGEDLKAVYWKDGRYIPDTLDRINHIFRDHYSGAVTQIDKKLIDLLFDIRITLDSNEPFQIISAYRTAKTNAYLRRHKKGVARHSLHMEGKAVDIRIPDRRLIDLRRAALKMKAGGVGYYAKSNFVHIDVGRIRFW